MKNAGLVVLLCLLIPFSGRSQVGGAGVYQTLKLPSSSRTAALGGYQIAVFDNELSLGFNNPSLLNKEMDGQMTLTHVDYLADINFGYAGYGYSYDSNLTFLAGIQYVNFGEFIKADKYGEIDGTFSGGDYTVAVGAGYKWKHNLHFGANLKFIYSKLANYYSSGLAMDLAVTHNWKDKDFVSALVIRNLGFQLTAYDENRENLPLDVQLGFSKRLANAPFRFNLMAHHLNIPDMTYINTNAPKQIDLETQQEIVETIPLSEKVLRHFIVGTEVLLSENFHIRVGYNHQRRKEMALRDARGGVGYSWGFGLRIWRFHIDYGRASYHMAGASNHFTITSNLSSWMKEEKPKGEL